MMCKLNLIELLSTIKDYVLIKHDSNFPDYCSGSDIDLLVMDRSEAIQAIRSYYEKNFYKTGQLRVTETKYFVHADFLFNNILNIRIDLIDNFDFYSKFSIKHSFLIKIFRDRLKHKFNGNECYIPSDEDDLTVRYLEYLEYFEKRPDKIKHLEYICSIDSENLKQRFFENTHRFIRFKRRTWNNNIAPPKSSKEALKIIYLGFKFLVHEILKNLVLKVKKLKIYN